MPATRAAFVAMLREEWRLHSHLFGGWRFAAFPVFVAGAGLLATWALDRVGTAPASVVAGVHVLVFLFGLQTGTIGFVGRDAMRNLLGDATLVVFAGRTLPLSRRRLLGLFLAKDACYYAALFLAPVALSLAPSVPAARLPALWASLVLTFVLGTAVTLAGVALATRGRAGRAAAVVAAGGVAAAWVGGLDLVRYTPLGLYRHPTLPTAVGAVGAIVALLAVGLGLYDVEYVRPARTARNAVAAWRDRLPVERPVLLVRTLLDVGRSSGGFWKVAFSAGVLFAVGAFLVDLASRVTGVRALPGVGFGALLSLSAFTTYNWLTQFDDAGAYLRYPLSVADVFRAKFLGFHVLGFPAAGAFYALAVVRWHPRPLDAVAGAALLVGLQYYLFGLTVYLAGFDPNEFLFDVALFAAFTAAVAAALVPPLVVGFVVRNLAPVHAAALVGAAVVVALVGLALYRRAVPRWADRLRAG